LYEEENEVLVAMYFITEIESEIKDRDENKIWVADGYNFAFVKKFKYLLKDKVRIMFDQSHVDEVLAKGMLAYFVALIQKVSALMVLKDYRPIYTLGSLYKLLAMVLARILFIPMNSIISFTQSVFLKWKNLVDGVLVVNELVDYAMPRK
jgi:magnesium-transporting ATPase (P-type)